MIPSQVVMEPFLFRNQYHKKKAVKVENNTSFQPVDMQKQLVTPKTPLQVLSELSSNMQEMKNNKVNNNDDETLTDDDNRNADDEIDSFPETIISENAQNLFLPLQRICRK